MTNRDKDEHRETKKKGMTNRQWRTNTETSNVPLQLDEYWKEEMRAQGSGLEPRDWTRVQHEPESGGVARDREQECEPDCLDRAVRGQGEGREVVGARAKSIGREGGGQGGREEQGDCSGIAARSGDVGIMQAKRCRDQYRS